MGLLPLADKLKSPFSGWVCFTLGATTSCIQIQGELSSFLLDRGWALPFPFSRLGFNMFVSISRQGLVRLFPPPFLSFPPLPAVPQMMRVTWLKWSCKWWEAQLASRSSCEYFRDHWGFIFPPPDFDLNFFHFAGL